MASIHSTPQNKRGAVNARPTKRTIARLWCDVRGIAALEFALVGLPLLITLLGFFEVGIILKSQNDLDNATQSAMRQIMTGAVQNAANQVTTAADFRAKYLCPHLPALSCDKLIVNASPVKAPANGGTGFSAFVTNSALVVQTTENTFCLGTGGATVYLQVVYPLPVLTAILGKSNFTSLGGKMVDLVVSSAAFRNEPFQANQFVVQAGCS